MLKAVVTGARKTTTRRAKIVAAIGGCICDVVMFTTEGWLQILRKLGLRSSSEADVMLECAKRVE